MFASNLQRAFGVRYLPVRLIVIAALAVGYLGLRTDPAPVDWLFAAAALVLGGLGAVAPLTAAVAQAGLLGLAVPFTGDGPAVVLVKIMAGLALFELAARRPARWAGIAAVALVAGSLVGKAERLPQDLPSIAYGLVVVLGVPLLLGTQLRSAWRLAGQAQRRAEAESQRAEAESRRAEAEIRRRESDARAARASERATIARELHDLVAHQIASILLRVGVARQVLPDLDRATRETFDDVHDCAATVLDDLRRLVRVLRSGEGISLIEPAGLREAVAETVERARQLGLDITTSLDDGIGEVEAVRALTVLRLCQEGLTNVAKHGGPGARVGLSIRLGTDDDPAGARRRRRTETSDRRGRQRVRPDRDAGTCGTAGRRTRRRPHRDRLAAARGPARCGPKRRGRTGPGRPVVAGGRAVIRVLLVDDQRLIRAGLRMLCEPAADLDVVGEAADGHTAVRLAGELRPDVVLMDLRMPGMDGITATGRILAAQPSTRVVALTTFDDDDHLYPALAAGACGFLVKDSSPDELLDAIRRAAAGDSPFSSGVVKRIVDSAIRARTTVPRAGLPRLTDREREVLALVGAGHSNADIAERLHLGLTTVKTHVASLMTKTGCSNRVRLAVLAVHSGLSAG